MLDRSTRRMKPVLRALGRHANPGPSAPEQSRIAAALHRAKVASATIAGTIDENA